MPSAKPPYDKDESWKFRQFSETQWEALEKRLQVNLRPLYPGKATTADPYFVHPADAWSNNLLAMAANAISMTLSHERRRSNEELRAEQADLLKSLKTTANKLAKHDERRVTENVSPDLSQLFGPGADVLGTYDAIQNLIGHVEESLIKIGRMPTAPKINDARSAAALEMAIQCLRLFKDVGGKVSATANKAYGSTSDAVKLLKTLGDEFGLCFDEATWRKTVSKAKKQL